MPTPNVKSSQSGFSLIEVLIAVVILSFGLLALAALQAGLFRAGAEAKARANATSLAQQVVEDAKTFAYLSPYVDAAGNTYSGPTYQSLDTAKLTPDTQVGGVTYQVCRLVRRYRFDGTRFVALNTVDAAACTGSAAGAVDPSVPEFKQVRVQVSWSGDTGQAKTVELTDTVAAVAPADGIQVVKTPLASSRGPEVWIVPPNKDNPQVVPIAVGDDQSAASSNPKPQQFIQDVSAATMFSVQTFTGSTSGEEVRLNRKLDVAAVSCVCATDSSMVSTASSPAYQAATWNGKQLAYQTPQTVPAGTPVGSAVVSQSSSDIEAMCTVCCRDHHEVAARQPRPDPYRALTSTEALGAEHYGYKQQGNSYLVGQGLFPAGTVTNGRYVDACQLVRVNGRMRMVTDARQNYLVETPLDDAKTGYRISNFIDRYSNFVTQSVGEGMASLPTSYPSPTAAFPSPTDATLSTYNDIVAPSAIALGTSGDTKKLVAFGLYIDYLNQDTIDAYNCAKAKSNDGACQGLGNRNPLETLPFYAVNVANLGSWNSAKPSVGSVVNATYDNKGLLATDGGTVTARSGSAVDPFPVSLSINKSNSGLAGTLPVDPDDTVSASFAADAQSFTKSSGANTGTQSNLYVKVGASSTLSLSTVNMQGAGITSCNYRAGTTTCSFASPNPALQLVFSNYTTSAKVKGTTVVTNRKICVPADTRVTGPTVANDGLDTETATLYLNLASTNYTLTVDIMNEVDPCPTGTAPLSP